MPQDEECAKKAEDIVKGRKDPAGERIVKVYSYNPPFYAIYRTRDRLIVQFADQSELRSQQRGRVVPLMPMRGQINGLINGWRNANDDGSTGAVEESIEEDGGETTWEPATGFMTGLFYRWWRRNKREQFRKVCRYDRRVADAIITVLEDENNLKLAQELLAQVKNDLIAERTAIARGQYVNCAFLLVIGLVALTGLLTAGFFRGVHRFPFELTPVWTAVAGGTIGAFFSIATGLKSRDVVIDLQNRENRIDVTLRMVIGAISGAILYSLFATGLVSTTLFKREVIMHGATIGPAYSDLTVFLIGFVAGFFERLVPNLLSKTSFGTTEPAGKDMPVQVVPAPGDAGKGGAEGVEGGVAEPESGDADPGESEGAGGAAEAGGDAVPVAGEPPLLEPADPAAAAPADPAAAPEEAIVVPEDPDAASEAEQPRPAGI